MTNLLGTFVSKTVAGKCICCYKQSALENNNYCKPCYQYHIANDPAGDRVFRRRHFHGQDTNWKVFFGVILVPSGLT